MYSLAGNVREREEQLLATAVLGLVFVLVFVFIYLYLCLYWYLCWCIFVLIGQECETGGNSYLLQVYLAVSNQAFTN